MLFIAFSLLEKRKLNMNRRAVATGLAGLFTFGVPAATATAIAAGTSFFTNIDAASKGWEPACLASGAPVDTHICEAIISVNWAYS